MRAAMILACLALGLFAVGAARADDCTPEKNPLNGQEKAWFSQFTKLRAAAPKAPAGWQLTDDSQALFAEDYQYLPASECDVSSYSVGVDVGYRRPVTQADAQQEMQLMQAPPDPKLKAEQDQLVQQQQDLMQKSMAAAQKQDYASMDKLGKQMDALNKKQKGLQNAMNAKSKTGMASIERDREAKVSLRLNNGEDEHCYGNPAPMQVAGGVAWSCYNPGTFDSEGNAVDKPTARIVVAFGKALAKSPTQFDWTDAAGKPHQDQEVEIAATLDNTLPPMTAENLFVVIESDNPERAQGLFKAMNFEPLRKLVKP